MKAILRAGLCFPPKMRGTLIFAVINLDRAVFESEFSLRCISFPLSRSCTYFRNRWLQSGRNGIQVRHNCIVLAGVGMLLLSFYVVDAIQLSSNFIRMFGREVTEWGRGINERSHRSPPLTEKELSAYNEIFFRGRADASRGESDLVPAAHPRLAGCRAIVVF